MVSRRNFLLYSGLAAVAVVADAGQHIPGMRHHNCHLATNLKPLFDPAFEDMAEKAGANDLIAELRAKGVVDENDEINTLVIKKAARTEQAIEYKGRYYNSTELELYCLAFLLNKSNQV